MQPRAPRAIAAALSIAMHALLLLAVFEFSIGQPTFPDQPPLPVRIIEPQARAPRRQVAPPRPAPPPPAAPPPVAQAPEPPPAPAPEAPEPAPEPPKPEKKIPVPEQQIVSPSEEGKNEPPPDTRLLSDRDNRVAEQMVKKGNPKPGDETSGDAAPAAKPAPPKPPKAPRATDQRGPGGGSRRPAPQVAALPGLDRLMPDALNMAKEGYGQPTAEEQEQLAQASDARRKPRGGEGMLIPMSGPIGTLDFLPEVREGNITLLNTKAEVFAPFVRRVAVRVFQNFLISLKRDIGRANLTTVETVEAEAVMNPSGEFVRFTINHRSTRISLASDRRLQQACNDGFFDRNPPPGARAKDGNIHFILRIALQTAPTPRGPAYALELSTGLL